MKYYISIEILIISIIMVLLFIGNSDASIIGEPILNPMNNHSYFLLSSNTWTASNAEAMSLGGQLVTIRNSSENQWIYDTFGYYGGLNRGIWLGFTDLDRSGNWIWISGEPITYTNWEWGEPNLLGQENWAMMSAPYWGRNGGWNNYGDIAWDGANFPICGVVEFVPEPGSLTSFIIGAFGIYVYRWQVII